MNEFYIGQRWISDTETSLGLGIVESVDHRLVTIFFPAVEQARSYAKAEAPLTRIQLRVGETLETGDRRKWLIKQVKESNKLFFYSAILLSRSSSEVEGSGDIAGAEWIPETKLHFQIHIQEAHKRLFAGQLDNHRWFQLRYEAWSHRHRQERQKVNGLAGGRTSLLPHQLYIAEQVNQHAVPRALLADEVGLGKTIEAGLIIHQRLFTEQARRVLIITPPALMHQWFVEMLRRFNLHFHIFDQSRIESLKVEFPDENPYYSEQLVLCNLDFLMTQDWQDIVKGGWDLVVVDEAHHLLWTEDSPSEEYQLVEAISRDNDGLI
ncbi:MAG TPA: SNF2-related protein, partial [Pseudomonadales bacterium]